MFEVDESRFEEMVADAMDSIPEDLAKAMDNVQVTVEDGTPDGPLYGLYEGHPLTSRTLWYDSVPDHITIFRLPICAHCHSEEEVRRRVHSTVVHEIGHHFGIDDKRLRELGW